ncbi:hypothetical protein Stube_14350 [Streptomyces tubercidicus]|uniref:Uncharacterized protein n=1 Tax=Streptomyces tubercidicus TaxID=47759 RepID=A0A640UN60_9ACTN|nr:hypothetical protein Stube_14350 [Streptomyces tubercidicus]
MCEAEEPCWGWRGRLGTPRSVPYGRGTAQPGARGRHTRRADPHRTAAHRAPYRNRHYGYGCTGPRCAPALPLTHPVLSRAVASCRRYWEKKVVSRVFVQVSALVQGTG